MKAYTITLPDRPLHLTTPSNLPKHQRTTTDERQQRDLPRELRPNYPERKVTVFHPTFVQIQQDLQQLLPAKDHEDGKRKFAIDNS